MSPAAGATRSERWALWTLFAFTAVSIAGYWNFALHPERLPADSFALQFYTVSFQFFARAHIVVAAAALGLVLVRRARLRWIGALAAVGALSFAAEHVGTGYGVPFGGYGYTALLGWRLGPRVPALIPLSWFLMALPAFVMARAALPSKAGTAGRLALGAVWLTSWDLALDPAMSHLTPYWVWEESGPYYGMPWMNLLGWFTTGVVLMTALEAFSRRGVFDRLPVGWMSAFYGLVVLMPLGMLAAAGAWLAVAVTLGALAVLGALTMRFASGRKASRGVADTVPSAGERETVPAEIPPAPQLVGDVR